MSKFFDAKDYNISLQEGIIVLKYTNSHITEEIARSVLKEKLAFINGGVYASIIDVTSVKKFDDSALEILNSSAAHEGLSKCAVLIKSRVQKVFFNFFLIVKRPQLPMKMFNSSTKAQQWLTSL